MTATTEHPAVTAVYPVHYQAHSGRCTHCWQHRDDVATRADPCGDGLRDLCARCDRALRSGWVADLTVDELTAMWTWLAHQHINHRAGEDTGIGELEICDALAAHTPAWMPPQVGWERFGGLMEDLATFHRAESGDVDYASLEPDWQDPEKYENHCRGLVDDAVHKLIGRKR